MLWLYNLLLLLNKYNLSFNITVTNKMKQSPHLLAILLSLSVLCVHVTAEIKDSRNLYQENRCYLFNKVYVFTITKSLYEKMPTWNLESKEPPPVSPQKAFEMVKTHIDKIEVPDNYLLVFDKVSLKPVSSLLGEKKLIWEVSFRARYKDNGWPIHEMRPLDYLVTLDGTLIEPVVTDQKPNGKR